MPEAPESERTALYRFYDDQNRLLYVGITGNPKARWHAHARDKDWWPQVARKTVEWFETRKSAERVEKVEVQEERPTYNLQHNPGRARELYNEENAQKRAEAAAVQTFNPWVEIHGRPDLG